MEHGEDKREIHSDRLATGARPIGTEVVKDRDDWFQDGDED